MPPPLPDEAEPPRERRSRPGDNGDDDRGVQRRSDPPAQRLGIEVLAERRPRECRQDADVNGQTDTRGPVQRPVITTCACDLLRREELHEREASASSALRAGPREAEHCKRAERSSQAGEGENVLAAIREVAVDGEADEHLGASEGREGRNCRAHRPMHESDASVRVFGSRYRFEKI